MREIAFHKFDNQMVNCRVLFVIIGIGIRGVVEKAERLTRIGAEQCAFGYAIVKSGIDLRDRSGKKLTKEGDPLLSSVDSSPLGSVDASAFAKVGSIKESHAPHRLAVEFHQTVLRGGVRYGVSDRVGADVKTDIIIFGFHIDKPSFS